MNKLKAQLAKLKEELRLQNFLVILFAGIINAIGITIFLYPVDLYDSGISGLSMLLDQVTPDFLNLSIFLIILNVPIFAIGYKKRGISFTIYSIFAVAVYSLTAFLMTEVLPLNLEFASPLAEKDLLLCAIFGGVLSGIGSGFVIRYGGAIDGLDVLSVLFAKKLNISIGTFVLIFNYILYTVCGFVLDSWILPLYSMVTYFVGSKTVDFIVDGFDKAKCVMIVTDKVQEVEKIIEENYEKSGTIVNAFGGHSKKDKNIIYFIASRTQIVRLKAMIIQIDPTALVALLDVSDVANEESFINRFRKNRAKKKLAKESEK